MNKIKIDGPILNNIDNDITSLMKKIDGKVGVLIPLSQKILNAAEKGIIKLTTSGLDGDTLLQANVVLITASDKNDLIKKLSEVIKS
ncbi:hypothetical protein DMP16_07345 [Sulfolobus sp. B1]|uniref:hypothetical protein n=1 Tax=Sulfolobus sp. B1 TaxID=2200888 RepID=UPI00117CCB4E|nr:hypothetical protein [Sulfolobus sp. B1]TRM96210.1 hypothetical protein DMP16_07345 [Sulfolobus sp. B1]